jgi:DNA-binding transcriptional ArsR family regulator/SAM-dependent methyltransferase
MDFDILRSVDRRTALSTANAEPVTCCGPLAASTLSDTEAVATAEVFKALADPARVRIVNVLATSAEPVCVCHLIEPLGLSQPTVSHHLKRLMDAGLLEREQRGRWAYFALRPDAVAKLASVVEMRASEPVPPAEDLREQVRQRYAASARIVSGSPGACGTGECCAAEAEEGKFGEALYEADQRGELPDAAVLASLGCGNPTAVADLHEGETVLDLGSGGGIDVILSARRVGSTGVAYGLDMTDEMLELARRNAREAGVANAHFLKGLIEQIPLPADSVDVVISNCVINLSTDKPAVLAEIGRVVRAGGRLGISDVVAEDHLSAEQRAQRGGHVGCIAGALSRREYEMGLEAAGFENVTVEFTHEVADGMHGAIVKAVRADRAVVAGLPVVQPAHGAGCC